jgi:hypothetical protein
MIFSGLQNFTSSHLVSSSIFSSSSSLDSLLSSCSTIISALSFLYLLFSYFWLLYFLTSCFFGYLLHLSTYSILSKSSISISLAIYDSFIIFFHSSLVFLKTIFLFSFCCIMYTICTLLVVHSIYYSLNVYIALLY